MKQIDSSLLKWLVVTCVIMVLAVSNFYYMNRINDLKAGYDQALLEANGTIAERDELINYLKQLILQKDSRIEQITNEREYFKAESMETGLEKINLQKELDNLNDTIRELESELTQIRTDYQQLLEEHYSDVNYTGNFGETGFTQTKEYVLDAGYSGFDEELVEFSVGYGIFMQAYVSLESHGNYESNVDIDLSWRREDQRGFLVGLGNAPAQTYKKIHVTAFCEIYDSGEDDIWIKIGAYINEMPSIRKDRLAYFSKIINP